MNPLHHLSANARVVAIFILGFDLGFLIDAIVERFRK